VSTNDDSPAIRVRHHAVGRNNGGGGPIGEITIDRRERFNSLDVRTAQDLRKAGLQLARDPDVRVIVLRGSHGVFCSGADLRYIREGGEPDDLGYLTPGARDVPSGYGEVFRQILEYLHSTIAELRRAPKPVIAAVDGVVAAGGLGLALACDIVVASRRATFEYAYAKTALCGAEGVTFLLPKLVGLRRALDMALLAKRLRAREALEAGLISEVFDDDAFDREVDALAARMAAGPTGAYASLKQLMNEALGIDRLDYHLDREVEALADSADSADFAEGLDAFFDKRRARFGTG
jgi:2-(1,2-epoxy-1,2-dihydrophenyl)acetyl-CoA isomerase